MAETYLVRAFWGDRNESLDRCAWRAEQLFKRLATCDDVFRLWFKMKRTAKAPNIAFVPTEEALRHELDMGRNIGAEGAVIEDLGFHLEVRSGTPGAERVKVGVFCGAYPRVAGLPSPNSCLIELPASGTVADRLLYTDRLIAIIEAVVSSWEPDWASLTSSELLEILPAEPTPEDMLGWTTYLSRRYGPLPDLAPEFDVQDLERFGTLITMKGVEHFTASDAAQVSAIERLADTLHQAGVLRLTPTT